MDTVGWWKNNAQLQRWQRLSPTELQDVSLWDDDNEEEEAATESESPVADEKELKRVTTWHYYAAAIQGISGAAILIALLVLRFGSSNEGFRAYLFGDTFELEDRRPRVDIVDVYEVGWVLAPMPFLTAFSHLIQAFLIIRGRALAAKRTRKAWKSPKHKTFCELFIDDLRKGVNLVRWIEYSVTASLMTWIIAQLSGVTNIYLVFLLAIVSNVALQWQGYMFELLMDRRRWAERCSPMIAGFVIFAGQWGILWTVFALTVHQNSGAPWFVWVSFIGLQTTFLVFPAIQLLRYYKVGVFKKWAGYEKAFVFASNLSKLLLDWTLFAAVISFIV